MTQPFSVITPALGLTDGVAFGPGFTRIVAVPPVGAGTQVSVRSDGAEVWRPMLVSVQLATSAVVANRGLFLALLDDDGNILYRIPQTTAVVASATVLAQWAQNAPGAFAGANGDLVSFIPSLLVYGGYSLVVGASALDAGDQISKARMYVEAYPAGPAAYPVGATRLYAQETP